MNAASADGPDPIDVAVGAQLRRLRRNAGMSQEGLGCQLGISFQQVQKYESGANRISASMLVKAARALGMKPTALLPEEGEGVQMRPAVLDTLARMNSVERLVEAYSRISSPRLRRAVLVLARSLADSTDSR